MEVVVGLVIAWAIAKARRVALRTDGVVDKVLDAALDRVGALVTKRLAGDSAVQQLEAEAATGEVSDRTRKRVELAVADAADNSPDFARELEAAVAAAKGAQTQTVGDQGVLINEG